MTKKTKRRETTSALFNRYIWLVDTIYRLEKITYEQICEMWERSYLNNTGEELPLRTFHHHRKAIEEIFDINIECDRRDGYKYYIENGDDMARGGVRTWLLNTFAVNNLINESHKIKHRILFEQIPSGQRYLMPIIEAMREGVCLEIEHQRYTREEIRTYHIEPYCVKVFRQRWYVVAKTVESSQIRVYSLDRILSLHQTDERYAMPTDFDGTEYFTGSFGVMNQEKLDTVVLKVYNRENKDKYFESLPLHHSQKIVERTDKYTIFRYEIYDTFDLYQELLSHGAEVEVLAPVALRERILKTIDKIITNYKINYERH